MFGLIGKRCRVPERSPAGATVLIGLERRVEELQATVNKMAADLTALLGQLAGQDLNVHVDKVCIDKVNLDQLTFNIDGIGVKDLSGSLSIGLNYGSRVIRLGPPAKPPGEKKPEGSSIPNPRPLGGKPPRVNFQASRREGENDDRGV
ncbi:hypothetical protein MTBGP_04870 [Moorella thermoacetica]|uniref:hypothetical protein n=1 Tax=Neomoorella thermoacetica TaxID=1525 RepID=UPI0030D218FD